MLFWRTTSQLLRSLSIVADYEAAISTFPGVPAVSPRAVLLPRWLCQSPTYSTSTVGYSGEGSDKAAADGRSGDPASPPRAADVEARAVGTSRRSRRQQQQPKPVAVDVAKFLAARGVDVGRLETALPLRASELTLSQVRDAWRLLRRERSVSAPVAAVLLRRAPLYLTADVEGNLRPKLELLGLRGEPLARLLGSCPNLPYARLELLRPLLARLEHYVGAAAAAGLLPSAAAGPAAAAGAGPMLPALMAARPGSWADTLKYSPGKVEAAHAALINAAGMDDAQFGAALVGFPGLIKYGPLDLRAKCQVLAGVLGGPREASALLTAAPNMLHASPGTLRANVAYLRHELGWSPEQVTQLAQRHWRTFCTVLTSAEMRRMLGLCEEVLGLAPGEVLSEQAAALVRAPEEGVVRLEFVARRGLRARLKGCRFLKDTAGEWARRLCAWGVPEGDFQEFEQAFWGSPEGAALLLRIRAGATERRAVARRQMLASAAARGLAAAQGGGPVGAVRLGGEGWGGDAAIPRGRE